MWITPLVVFAMLATLLWFNRGDNRDGSQSHQVQLSQTRTSLAPRLRNTLKSAPVAGPGATSAPLNDHANQNKNSPSVKAVVTFASMDTSGAWARTVPLLREVACMLKAHHPGGVTTAVRFQVSGIMSQWSHFPASCCCNVDPCESDHVSCNPGLPTVPSHTAYC